MGPKSKKSKRAIKQRSLSISYDESECDEDLLLKPKTRYFTTAAITSAKSFESDMESDIESNTETVRRSNRRVKPTERLLSFNNDRTQELQRKSYLQTKAKNRKENRKFYRDNEINRIRMNGFYTADVEVSQNRTRINGLFTTLECKWNKECKHCGYIHLDCATEHMQSNCCYGGRLAPWDDNEMYERYAYLRPLSEQMRHIMIDNIEHFGRLSSAYNNMLSICRIGVENGNRETGAINTHPGGFERRVGDHAVTVCGRTYHCIPTQIKNRTDPAGQ